MAATSDLGGARKSDSARADNKDVQRICHGYAYVVQAKSLTRRDRDSENQPFTS
jgi:hypothetical protein